MLSEFLKKHTDILTDRQKKIITRMKKENKYYLTEVAGKIWDKKRRWTKTERANLCLSILAYARPELFKEKDGNIIIESK